MNSHISGLLFLIVLVGAVVAIKALGLQKQPHGGQRGSEPQYGARVFLSPTELAFFAAMRNAVGQTYHICCKVNLGDLVSVGRDDIGARNTFSQKHVDFVLCDPRSMTPQLLIELDDGSHSRPSAQRRDGAKDAAINGAGLRLLRYRSKQAYSPDHIRQEIANLLGSQPGGVNAR